MMVSSVLYFGERQHNDSRQPILTWTNRQDLNVSVLTGSCRVVDHTTFSELQWRRDPFSPNFYILPPGFQSQSHLLGKEFVDVLKDIYALQCIRDSTFFDREDAVEMAHVDNHQASIQSRLVSLPNHSSTSECCHLAAYLCSAMLRCKLWRGSTVPVSQLYKLRSLPDCANFGRHSPTFPYNYSANYNKRMTILCGMISLIY